MADILPTPEERRMLQDVHAHGNWLHSARGRKALDAAMLRVQTLRQRGWLDGNALTRAGYAVLGVPAPDRPFRSDPELVALVGQPAGEAEAVLAGRDWRYLSPMGFHTADLKTGRINVHLDDSGQHITKISVE
ncbi:hypothetical protein [Cupriavidus sp. TMH.W2]|uniref:hypothetical protein n=1 Tax=Cupriavidus sp. TMH.W2 TaxID=3434465 RepID=UPI003D77E177